MVSIPENLIRQLDLSAEADPVELDGSDVQA